jgi:hypothetical protein
MTTTGYAPAFDPVAHARAVEMAAETSRNTGRWLQWAMVAYVVAYVSMLAAGAAVVIDITKFVGDVPDSTEPFRVMSWSLLAAPLQLGLYAFLILLIAWIYHAGKFAELHGWPAARNRTLGAFSVLIPILSFWWPYEAVRDLYPPGRAPRLVLRWWLSYLLIPIFVWFVVLIPAVAGSLTFTIAFGIVGVALLCVPAVLGWRLVDDVRGMQRAYLAP